MSGSPDSQDRKDGRPVGLCSELSARRGLPLIGSAGCYRAILVFELATPWTAKIAGSRAGGTALEDALATIGKKVDGVRVIAVEPDGDAATSRVLWFEREPGSVRFGRYARCELESPLERLAETLIDVAMGGAAAGVEPSPPGVRDLLVCTHGSRDACCGRFGYPVYRELCALAEARKDVRVWRSSHLGGHRFAPTLLDLPSGRMFGRIGAGDAAAVFGGGAALVARLDAIYRGRCVLPEPAQVVERRLWLETGASFETAELEWSAEEQGGAWRVDLAATLATSWRPRSERGSQPVLRASAEVERDPCDAVVTPASCGRDPEPEAPWKIRA